MFEQLERIFRAMNRARNMGEMVATAMRGLEIVIPGARARVVPTGFDVAARLKRSGLQKSFILEAPDLDLIYETLDGGKTVVSAEGVDSEWPHCCLVPFDGGLVYLDSQQPFTTEQASIAGMVTQQLLVHLNRNSEGLIKSDKDVLEGLPSETWLGNQLHAYDAFSIIALEIDGYDAFREKVGGFVVDKLLRETAVFLNELLLPDERLARCPGGEFLILSSRIKKPELAEFWHGACEGFESLGEAQRHKMTLSAGIAVCPDDGLKFEIKGLAQGALSRAGRVGRRIIMVAEPPSLTELSQDDPRSHFDARSAAVVKLAVSECQAAHRAVDAIALLNAFFVEERRFADILLSAGLSLKDLRRLIREGEEQKIEFAPATMTVFGLSLEFAHRAGRKSVGIEDLFLACLTDQKTELQLRACGLQYGAFLAHFYRCGHFHHATTFLLGELQRPEPRKHLRRQMLPKEPIETLPTNFGANFTAEVWGLLAAAKREAQAAKHYLDFAHLYIALLEFEGANARAEKAREALEKLDLEVAPNEVSHPTSWVVDFFRHLGYEHEELTIEALSEPLRTREEIQVLRRLMGEADEK